MTLTEDELDALRLAHWPIDPPGGDNKFIMHARMKAAVETILTDRLARVEALADEPVIPYPAECQCAHGMGFQFHRYPCRYATEIPKSAIRAALAAAPSREGGVCPTCGSRKVTTEGASWCAVCDDCPPIPSREGES